MEQVAKSTICCSLLNSYTILRKVIVNFRWNLIERSSEKNIIYNARRGDKRNVEVMACMREGIFVPYLSLSFLPSSHERIGALLCSTLLYRIECYAVIMNHR
jgi:hypothetical protein